VGQKKERDRRYVDGYSDGVKNVYEYTLTLIGKGHTASEVRLLLRARVNDILIELQKVERPKREESELPEIESGCSYLFTGSLDEALAAFLNEVKENNRSGLIIARETPDSLIKRGLPEDISILWLTGEGSGKMLSDHVKTVSPTDTTILQSDIVEFIGSTPNCIIIFEGVEYIREQSQDFAMVLKLVNMIKDRAYKTGASLVVYVSGEAMDKGELGRLKRAIGNAYPS